MGLTSSQSSSLTVPSDQLHGRRGGWRPWVSMVGYFRANHAAGVSSLTRFAGKFSKPGSTALRYSRTAICCLRHVSTIEMMAATRGPACSLPTWIQFLRLWKAFHNRKNWIHIGSKEAGPRVAAIISVVETCRRLKIPLRDYLGLVLPGLGDFPVGRTAELTPAAWATLN